jgi:hypothetical protein
MPTPAKYEGPFKHRAQAPRTGRGWLSPWRLYSIGAIAALGLTAFYLLKFTFTPDMIRAMNAEDAPAPEEPRGSLGAWCLPAGGGAPVAMPPAPFCTEARPAGCRDGDTLQVTYTAPHPAQRHLYAAVVNGALSPEEITGSTSKAIRPGARDVPIGQWRVRSAKTRSHVALVGMFAQAPLESTDLGPWLEAWRRERMLSRPPQITQALAAKGAALAAFLLCVGK